LAIAKVMLGDALVLVAGVPVGLAEGYLAIQAYEEVHSTEQDEG
jgi:hypothetical protein